MKYRIEKPTSEKFKIGFVKIVEIAPMVLFIHIDTDDCKWPLFVYGADGDCEDITFMTPGDEPVESCTVTFIPEKEWEKDVYLAKHSGRYGWGGFAIASKLVNDNGEI